MASPAAVVLVVPLAPAETGNGLAMRAGMLLDALAPAAPVHVVVVPVSGPAGDCSWAATRARTVTVVEPVTGDTSHDHLTRQLGDPELRARLERTAPLPTRAALAPPTAAATAVSALPDDIGRPAAVLAMRLYLAPFGMHLAHLLSAGRAVVDVDDDDAALLRTLGDHAEAEAFERLARCWLPDADAVCASSSGDAARIAATAGLDHASVVPNAVRAPAAVPPPPGADRVLFVGNLTYEPNRVAARLLGREILPALRCQRPAATLDLVGSHGGSLDDLAGLVGVRLAGEVPDVAPCYADADAAVAPLRHGAGTRIKVLEAFAHRRPVVATPTAIAGLEVEHEEVVIAEPVDAFAEAVGDLLDDPGRSAAMVERAAHLLTTRYSPAAVAPLVRAAVLGTPAADGPGDHAPGGFAAA